VVATTLRTDPPSGRRPRRGLPLAALRPPAASGDELPGQDHAPVARRDPPAPRLPTARPAAGVGARVGRRARGAGPLRAVRDTSVVHLLPQRGAPTPSRTCPGPAGAGARP